jgi:GTP-binding protein
MDALVVDEPGVTRDRQWGQGEWEDQPYIVIDTGGIIERPTDSIEIAMLKQSRQALQEADVIFFVLDARGGLTAFDQSFARELRTYGKTVFIVVNKIDGLDQNTVLADFYRLGFDHICAIAASQNRGIGDMLDEVFAVIHANQPEIEEGEEILEPQAEETRRSPKVAIVGRPNVGKSTLVNRFLGEERVIVCDHPGTTRDSIYIPLERRGKNYTLIDTAGVRKRKKITEVVEKFSVVKTLQAIKNAHVVLLVMDAKAGVTDQDMTLIEFIIEAGKGLIICANKWDGMLEEEKESFKAQLYRFNFCDFAPIRFISALYGTGVGDLFGTIDKVYDSAMVTLESAQLTEILEAAIEAHSLPVVKGRRIKLRFAHCGGHNPPIIVIHGNQTDSVPPSYQRYISNYFIKALDLVGTPVKVVFKTGENPFAGRRNTLTPRQMNKRKRLMKHVRKLKRKEKST